MKKPLILLALLLAFVSAAPACGYMETCPIDGESATFDSNTHFEDGYEFREYRHVQHAYGPDAVTHTFIVRCN